MNKLILLTLLVLLGGLTNCAHTDTATDAQSAASDDPQGIPSGDITRLQELARIRSQVGNEAWPGFGQEELGMVLVDRHLQWAMDIDEPPKYYVRAVVPSGLKDIVQTLSVTKAYRDGQGELHDEAPASLYRAFSKEQTGNHYHQSVLFVKTLGEYQKSGEVMDSETWIHISLHELFHVYQDRYVKYTPDFMKAVDVSFKSKIGEDSEHNKLLEPELKLLKEAVCAEDVAKVKSNLKNAMKLRAKRWDFIAKKYKTRPDTWERYDSWAEGTAYYVEHQMMSKWGTYADQTLLKNDPSFKGFAIYKPEHKEAWCETVSMPRKSYWYSLGFAYSMIMDRLDIDWKKKKPTALFFDGYFKDFKLMP